MKKKKTRRKMKKKGKIILLFILLIFIICGGFIYLNHSMKNDNSDLSIKILYNYAKVNKDSKIFDKGQKEIGNITKDSVISIKGNSTYYNIVGTNFYVKKNDITFIKYKKNNDFSNYVELGKEIVTKDKFIMENGDNKITINKSNKFRVLYMDNENYYINNDSLIFKINKNDIASVKDYDVKTKISNNISVINFNNISDKCTSYECYSVDNTKKVLDYIKNSKYYTINVGDFVNWDLGNLKLKENAVLLMTSEGNDFVKTINEEYNNMINVYTPQSDLTYLNNNTTNKINTNVSALNNYNVRSVNSLDDVKKMLLGKNVEDKFFEGDVASSVPVLNYHFFYDLSKGQTNCTESICENVVTFRKHLDYLRDNGYTTLTMQQFLKWIYGEIEVPKKSVLITIDDGAYGTGFHNNNNLIPILEEYRMHATLFLITGWWSTSNYRSSYLEIQSHTHDMHNKGKCGDAQLICASYDEIMNDLAMSINTIGNKDTFCYPFYRYDDEAIKALKDSGFKLAFAGGNVNATRNSNKYAVPRYPIHDTTSMDRFIKMVS